MEDSKEFEKVNVSLNVNIGACHLKSTKNPGVFSLYSHETDDHFTHTFNKDIDKGVCNISLRLQDVHSESLGKSISSSLFGNESGEHENFWKIFLSENKVYNLNLEYGIGSANIDLGNLSVENFKIHSGSADINVGYFTDGDNKIEMDTFYVQSDLGNVIVKNLNRAHSSYVVANVGFGNILLDLSDLPSKPTTINGNVGAGTLFITIPSESTPMKLVINESWLCRVKIPENFSKQGSNVYVNKEFMDGGKNPMLFNLDVSMGSLIFQEN